MPEIINIPTGQGKPITSVPRIYPNQPLNLQLDFPYSATYDVNYRPGMNQEWNRSDNQW